jgi:hypothetical protein
LVGGEDGRNAGNQQVTVVVGVPKRRDTNGTYHAPGNQVGFR